MKLLIHLEDIEKLRKEGFKRKDAEQDFSGSQGKTTKWAKEYKSGAKETVFNKQNDDWIFSSITALSALLSELIARDIIKAINAAGHAYGYPTDLYPVSKDYSYSIKFADNKIFVNQTSSAFNSLNSEVDRKGSEEKLVHLFQHKLSPFNLLMANQDRHGGNFATHPKKKSIYAIDFGLVLVGDEKYLNEDKEDILNKIKLEFKLTSNTDKQKERIKKKVADFYAFFDLFIQHNKSYMVDSINNNVKKISKDLAKAVYAKGKPRPELENEILSMIGLIENIGKEKKKLLVLAIQKSKELIKEVNEIIK